MYCQTCPCNHSPKTFGKNTNTTVLASTQPDRILRLSQSALNVVTFLRSLADRGQGILCTIHKSSAEIFQVSDRTSLLRKGGKTVYFGDLGHKATTLIEYFENNGTCKYLPDENPAEYMLEIIGAGATARANRTGTVSGAIPRNLSRCRL
ncbi:hypothetical protein AX15_006040 [Amanita polypyramis BW_CC]|nr:hypothetical protein AX15_006040 [Amanita polypyramis BW_CC]